MDSDSDDGITGWACLDSVWLLLRGPTVRQILRQQRRRLLGEATVLTRRVRTLERGNTRLCEAARKASRANNMLEARRQALDVVHGRAEHARLVVQRKRFHDLASRLEREANSLALDEGMQRVVESVGARLATMPPEHFEQRMAALQKMDARERLNDVTIERVFSTMVDAETTDALTAVGINCKDVDEVLIELGIDAGTRVEEAPVVPHDDPPTGGETPAVELDLQARLDALRHN